MGQGTTVPGSFDVDLVVYSDSKNCVSADSSVYLSTCYMCTYIQVATYNYKWPNLRNYPFWHILYFEKC